MTTSYRRERGHCSVCGGNYAVTIEGRLSRHYPDQPPLVRLSSQSRCAGSRTLSREIQSRSNVTPASLLEEIESEKEGAK